MSDSRASRLWDKALEGCPCAGGNLERFIQPAVLAVLADGPVHGYGLVAKLAEMPMFAGTAPDSTGVYRFLRAMERRGLVTAEWDTADAGPAKRRYRLTPRGGECLGRWAQTVRDYRRQLDGLLTTIRRARTQVARSAKAKEHV